MRTISILISIAVVVMNWYSRVALAFSNFGCGDGTTSYYHYMSDGFTGNLSQQNFTRFLKRIQIDVSTTANSFTTIGMPITGENVEDYIKASGTILTEKSHLLRSVSIPGMDDEDCKYIVYPSESGGQLWGALHERIYFGGFVPHFEGKSRIKMCIMTTKPDPCIKDDGTVCKGILDGGMMGVPDEDGEALEFLYDSNYVDIGGITLCQMVSRTDQGLVRAGYGFADPDNMRNFFSFEFGCPNFAFLNKHASLPVAVTIQLSAFAREIRTFDTVEEYELKQSKLRSYSDGIPVASKFFGADTCPSNKNNRYACIVGHVVDTELKKNELTQRSFYWALIRTDEDMEIDVVIHPRLCSHKPPQIGGVIQGYFYLSGLLLLDGGK
eukprot:jgi/Psemu1/21529/gm1.21529_g